MDSYTAFKVRVCVSMHACQCECVCWAYPCLRVRPCACMCACACWAYPSGRMYTHHRWGCGSNEDSISHQQASKAGGDTMRGSLLTLEVGELQVVVVQRQVVLHGGQAAGSGGQISHTLMFTMQHLGEVVCNQKTHVVHVIS